MKIFNQHVKLQSAIAKTRETGYYFIDDAVTLELLQALEVEAQQLKFEEGDHIAYPINQGAPTEVQQFHERIYLPLDNSKTPTSNQLCHHLSNEIQSCYPELKTWLLNEIGFQRYRNTKDWISPHRDRKSDQFLSLTITIKGSAWINIYRALTDPPDYSRLQLKTRFLVERGTAMFLRAPGFGNGQQIIHEVGPPLFGERLIVNLRMRPTILKSPEEYSKIYCKVG